MEPDIIVGWYGGTSNEAVGTLLIHIIIYLLILASPSSLTMMTTDCTYQCVHARLCRPKLEIHKLEHGG